MAPRRSGLHSLLNSTDTPVGYGAGPEPVASPPSSSDSCISTPRSPSGSSLSPTSPRRLRSSMASRTETFRETGGYTPQICAYDSESPEGSPNTPPTIPPLAQTVGGKFPVSVDTYSASKEASGKRQKNADASARYRRRKADQAAEEKSRISELEDQNRHLGGWVIELTRQKEFYRDERRALREIMMGAGLEDAARNRPDSPQPTVEPE